MTPAKTSVDLQNAPATGRALNTAALAGVAVFLCLAEVTAGYAVTVTDGAVQLILTLFVVVAPLVIGGGLCYGLLWRSPQMMVAAAPLPADGPPLATAAPRSDHPPEQYSPLAHQLIGVLDALLQELPAAADQAMLKRPASLRLISDLGLYESLAGPARRAKRNTVRRVTVGSVNRAAAALKYPFLGDDLRRSAAQTAIQALSSSEPNYLFHVRPDGTIQSVLNLNELQERVVERTAESDELLLLRVLVMMQGQLIIVFLAEEEALARPGPHLSQFVRGIHNISLPLDASALVISDEGDLYGTLADVIERHEPLPAAEVAS